MAGPVRRFVTVLQHGGLFTGSMAGFSPPVRGGLISIYLAGEDKLTKNVPATTESTI